MGVKVRDAIGGHNQCRDLIVNRNRSRIGAAERARWLAELSAALEEAHRLAFELGLPDMRDHDATELCARLSAARAQVQGLQLARTEDASNEPDPNRTIPIVWSDRRDSST